MSDTVFTLIFGVLVGALPSVFAFLGQLLNGSQQRAHELHIKRIEIFTQNKVQALSDYSRLLGICTALDERKSDPDTLNKYRHEYRSAYESLMLFASKPTRDAMLVISDPVGMDIDDVEVCTLNDHLNREYRNALAELCSSAVKKPNRSRKPVD